MTRKNFLAHYTAFVQFALKLAKVARESGIETLGHVVEDLEETEKVFKEGLRIILTEPENGAIANEILTNMTSHERDKYKRLYMTIQKRAVGQNFTLQDLDNPSRFFTEVTAQETHNGMGRIWNVSYRRFNATRLRLSGKQYSGDAAPFVFEEIILGEPDEAR
jgi:hypothetical protein